MESKSVVTVLGLSPLYTIILSFIDDTQCIYFNMTCKKYYQNASVKLNGNYHLFKVGNYCHLVLSSIENHFILENPGRLLRDNVSEAKASVNRTAMLYSQKSKIDTMLVNNFKKSIYYVQYLDLNIIDKSYPLNNVFNELLIYSKMFNYLECLNINEYRDDYFTDEALIYLHEIKTLRNLSMDFNRKYAKFEKNILSDHMTHLLCNKFPKLNDFKNINRIYLKRLHHPEIQLMPIKLINLHVVRYDSNIALNLVSFQLIFIKLDFYAGTLDYMPKTLKQLYVGNKFNKSVNHLPASLCVFSVGENSDGEFDQPLDKLPVKLISLTINGKFNQKLNNLPQLMELKIKGEFNNEITLPNSLEMVYLSPKFKQSVSIDHLSKLRRAYISGKTIIRYK